MHRLLNKLQLEQYLSSRFILGLDLLTSMLASLCTLVLVRLLFRGLSGVVELSWVWLGLSFVASYCFFGLLRTYRIVVRHTTLRDIGKISLAVVGKELLLSVVIFFSPSVSFADPAIVILCILDFLLTVCALMLCRVGMVIVYDVLKSNMKYRKQRMRVLVYGTDEQAVSLVSRLRDSNTYFVVGFLTYGRRMRKMSISDTSVYYFENNEDLQELYSRYDIAGILFASDQILRSERERLIRFNLENDTKILVAPPIDELEQPGRKQQVGIREIKIEDLLGRPEIKISMKEIVENFQGKVVMVTGAAGSIGSELCRQLAGFGVEHLVLFDNAETPMHNIRLELEERFPQLRFTPVIGDVRFERRLDFAFRKFRPQIVFHAAAYKHVPLMEENPCEAVLVNVTGSRYVADKCIEYGVEKMVMISTDKAVNPTNVMGCTKRLAEIYVQAFGLAVEQGRVEGRTKFVTTRFGNVLGSNGSVIPRFREQIAKGGPVTVTHPDITRFFMTIPEACRLVMEAATMTDGNQIFVFDMGESVKIANLAKRMIELAGLQEGKDIQIEYTGLRPGEKLYEEVLSDTENTIPTKHDRIRIAKVREYNYPDAVTATDALEELSYAVNIPDMVRLMKRTVPEFKSKNSVYEMYDKELEEEATKAENEGNV